MPRLRPQVHAPIPGSIPVTRPRLWVAALLGVWLAPLGAARLTIADGVVVKLGNGAGIAVRDSIATEGAVVLTSVNDNTAGGATVGGAPPAQPGDWRGLSIDTGAYVADVLIDGLEIRYAGDDSCAGLEFGRLPYVFDQLSVSHSIVGVRASNGGSARLMGTRLIQNATGLQVDGFATPVIVDAEIAGNTRLGIENHTPSTTVIATGNWWGHPSGPFDPIGNPTGQGNGVSTGVDYGEFLPGLPLTRCSVAASDGQYNVVRREVLLEIRCAQANEYRLAESPDFGAAPYLPFTSPVGFTLSPGTGPKTVYAQFRGAAGQTRTVPTPQPFNYTETVPQVALQAPPEGAILITDTEIRATASDPIGIDHVEFRYGSQSIGIDEAEPYATIWQISSVPDGEYTISAIATNQEGRTSTATRTVRVRRLQLQPDAYTLNEGEVLFVDAPGVLANDSISQSPGTDVQLVQSPSWGTVQLEDDGSFAFQPDSPDRHGVTAFTYRVVADGIVAPAAQVTLTVVPVNDPPLAEDDAYQTDENVQLAVPAPGLLADDSDVDSPTLTARLQSPPSHGEVTVQPDGAFSYVPAVNFRGSDSFDYQAVDGQGAATTATVMIQVTQPPTATNDVYLVDQDTPLAITDEAAGVVANDHDAPENDLLVAVPTRNPDHGTLLLQPDGTFTYGPDPGFVGIDTFRYQVTDGLSLSNVAVVTLAVGITSLPRAYPDHYVLDEDQELIVPAAQGLLANDLDADTPLAELRPTVVEVSEYGLTPGNVVVSTDGGFRVRPNPEFSGETFFAYQVFDGTSVSNVALVTLTVNPVNDGVQAEDDFFGVTRNTVFQSGYSGSIETNDVYDPAYQVNFAVVSPSAFGQLELNPQTGATRYTPQQTFSGVDTFVYRVFQVATGISDTATVTLRVNGPPIANPDHYVLLEDSTTTVSPGLMSNDLDPDGDPIRLSATHFSGTVAGGYVYGVGMAVDSRVNPTIHTATTSHNFYGTTTFGYFISDGIVSVPGIIEYEVLPVPDDPVAAPDSYLTQQGTQLSVTAAPQSALANDHDPDTRIAPGREPWAAAAGADLAPLRAELVSSVSHGSLTFAENGTFTYVPDQNYSGEDTFAYRAIDGTGRTSQPALVRIRVNSPPIAVDDAFVVTEDSVLGVSASAGVLSNDLDPDNDSLRVELQPNGCSPCHGTVSLRQDGGFRYTPDENYFGADEFYYQVVDAVAGNAIGRVSLTVLPVNDAPVTERDTYRTDEDVVLQAPTPQGVLRNDREVDGERLTNAQLLTPPNHGAVIVGSEGGFSYTPDPNFNGQDEFRYRVYDESNLYTNESVEILITPINDAPDAQNDSYAVDRDRSLSVPASTGTLANDSDVDGPAMSATTIGPPLHGQLSLAADGSFEYQPDGVFVGIDQFQYQVDDGLGAVDTASVTINVRDVSSPVQISVADDFYTVVGATLTVPAPGVLANDSVVGAPGLVAALVTPPQTGNVTLNPDGSFHFSIPGGFTGTLSFSYSAAAGGSSELALVTLQVQSAINAAPVAVGEQFGVLEDATLDSRSTGGLLVNDRDPEGAPLVLQLQIPPTHGVLDALPNGQFTYQPAVDFHGTDGFSYRVFDGTSSSNLARSTITVFPQNDPPLAMDDGYQTLRDHPLTVPAGAGLLANDSDVDGDTISVEVVDAPIQGQVQASANGAFSYQPPTGYSGGDHFRYAVTDGTARSIARVSINVAQPGNQPPVVSGEFMVMAEDGLLSSDSVGLLTANDSDPEGDALVVMLADPPAHGSLVLDGAAFEYRPAADFHGTDRFTYRVSDGALTSGPVAAEITVNPVNDAPRPQPDLYLIAQGQILTIPVADGVLANDTDVEGEPLSVTVASSPGHGSLSLATQGGFVYQPAASFHGRDEFGYRVSDGNAFAIGRAVIDVSQSANQRPIANGEVFAIPEDTVLDTRSLQSLLANDVDADGQPLSLVILSQPQRGLLEELPAGHVRYTPERDDTGTVRFGYSVSDGELQSLPVEVEILLQPRNDPPQAVADQYALAPTQPSLVVTADQGVLANDHEPDGDTLLVSVVSPPASGSLNLGLDGSLLYAPIVPRPPSVTFTYRVTDAAGLSAEAPVQILLGGDPPGEQVFSSGFEGGVQ